MSFQFASFERDSVLGGSPMARLPVRSTRPRSAALRRSGSFDPDRIARAGEDISSLLLLIPVALLAIVSFGAMLTPL